MTVKCHVYLLDGSEVEFEIGKNAKASTLLDNVCKHLDIVEKDYFGLIYKGSPLQKAWLSLDKKIKKQISKKESNLEFDFAVKFYPTDPTKLKEEITRYQICLQIRRDLASHLDCSIDKLTHLLSYWLQSEFEGKNDHSKIVKDCMKDFQNPPEEATSAEFIDRVLTLYRSRQGMASADADNQFLSTATSLRTYGVHFYKGKERAGNEIFLGISSKGVVEKKEGQAPVSHSWSRIRNIVYKNHKFKLKLLRAPTSGDPRLKKTFLFESESQVHSIWKSAVDHHVFFRVGEKDKKPRPPSDKKTKKRSSLLRRLSSKKKKPKTEMDAQQESEGITRRQPTVTRTSSLRRSASLRRSTTSGSSASVELPTAAGAEGGATYSVSREPQMDSESSSSEETKPHETDFPEPQLLPTPLPADETYAQIVDNPPAETLEEVRAYKDEDIEDAGLEKSDEVDEESSTLLLTQTIPEEDEDEHPYALPSPTKRHHPIQLASLRDDDLGSAYKKSPEYETRSRPLETDLDAENLRSPMSLLRKEETLPGDKVQTDSRKEHDVVDQTLRGPIQKEESLPSAITLDASRQDDDILNQTQDFPLQHSQYADDYAEVWEDVDAEPITQPKKDVRFAQEGDILRDDTLDEEAKAEMDKESRKSSSSSEGEVHFNLKGEQQIQTVPEEKILRLPSIPIPTFDDLYHPMLSTEDQDNFATIQEYVPKIRQESTEEDSEEENGTEEDNTDSAQETHEKELSTAVDDMHPEDVYTEDHLSLEDEDNEFMEKSEPEIPNLVSFVPLPNTPGALDETESREYNAKDAEEEEEEEDDKEEEEREQEEKEAEEEEDSAELQVNGSNEQDVADEVSPAKAQVIEKEPKRDDSPTAYTLPTMHDIPPRIAEVTMAKYTPYRSSTNGLGIDFRIGEPYKSYAGKYRDKIPDGAASTTAATIGDEDDLALEELDDDIQYEIEKIPVQDVDDDKVSEPSDDDKEQNEPRASPPSESASRSTSLSDITDNTDELLQPDAHEKAFSEGAGLDPDDELIQILFRTPPRKRKHRNRSEINPRDVRAGKQQAMAFRTTIDEELVTPRRRENIGKRPFIPSWPFHPDSLLDSRDLANLDREAVKAAMDAQKELLEEEGRLEDMNMMEDVDFSLPDEEEIQSRAKDREKSPKAEVVVHPPDNDEIAVRARSRSPSASPRMVGEEFIPGVPDFVHSVVPYQLKTPFGSEATTPVPSPRGPIDQESMKFPKTIIKFSSPEEGKMYPKTYQYSPTVDISSLPVGQCQSDKEDGEVTTFSESAVPDNTQAAETTHLTTSSGRSTPQSGAGTASTSEGTSSSKSKSSSSSFPRFIHSVFPLRRSSSNDHRGRSKTRRKREKKITKQKNKKKPRSKSNDKKNSKKPLPTIEVTSSPDVEAFKGFSILPSPPHYTTLALSSQSSTSLGYVSDLKPAENGENLKANENPRENYDEESIDKIILTESDDAHSDSGTPETVRRVEGFTPKETQSEESAEL